MSPGTVAPSLAPRPVAVSTPPTRCTKVAPIAAERFALHITIGKDVHDKRRHAKNLLSHRIPNGDLAEVLDCVLDLAIKQLDKQRFGATDRPRRARRPTNPRTIPITHARLLSGAKAFRTPLWRNA